VWLDRQDPQVVLETLVRLEGPERLDPQDQLEIVDLLAAQVRLVQTAPRDLSASQDHKEELETPDLLDQRVLQGAGE